MKARNLILTVVFGLQALFISFPFITEARDLISVIVADTRDQDIGISTAADLKKMRATVSKIASKTNMKLRQVVLSEKNTLPSKMLETIKKLTVKQDDVIMFYFTGHGYRTPSKGSSLWPNLYFSIPDEGVEYEKVVSLLQKKNPRLLITMADVCNNVLEEMESPFLVRGLMVRSDEMEKKIAVNYRRLFLETKGMIRITSSKAGEFAWCTKNGGLFTNAFLRSFDQAMASSTLAEWSTILDQAAYEVEMDADDQHPVYVIDTK